MFGYYTLITLVFRLTILAAKTQTKSFEILKINK